MKFLGFITGIIILSFFPLRAEALTVDAFHDGYIEDFTRNNTIDPDGIPDRTSDTNGLLASRGKFGTPETSEFNVDSHIIMAFNISAYAGQNLASAFLTGYGTRVDNKGSLDPISGEFYIYNGDGVVGLGDFNTPANYLGSKSFQTNAQGFNLLLFQLDVTSALQTLFDSSASFVEFRVESESATVFINAGETDPIGFHSVDTRWAGPKLELSFQQSSVVPEPATLSLFGLGLLGLIRRKQK